MYNRQVPRYTSFPTALQFTGAVAFPQHRQFLAGLDARQPFSLYLHIPFCHSLCHYCGCHTKITSKTSVIRDYLALLHQEIDLASTYLPGRLSVSRVHFGGGSPNYPDIPDFADLLKKLAEHFHFGPHTQMDMEVDPRLLTPQKINAYAELGITRMSLGVQDFNPEVQVAVNRIQPFDEVAGSVQAMRKAGIDDINFDLMTGLPCQTCESLIQTTHQALSLRPDRLAVFAYAHVPWLKKHQQLLEPYGLPGTEERLAMMQAVTKTLVNEGYQPIGIDHFARPDNPLYQALQQGRLHRNFQGYTDDNAQTILGFGLSAISSFGHAYTQSVTDARLYRQALNAHELPTQRGYILTPEDQLRRRLIETLMCYLEVDLSNYPHPLPEELDTYVQQGLVCHQGTHLRITEKGRPFTRLVASLFDHHLNPRENRHAQAI